MPKNGLSVVSRPIGGKLSGSGVDKPVIQLKSTPQYHHSAISSPKPATLNGLAPECRELYAIVNLIGLEPCCTAENTPQIFVLTVSPECHFVIVKVYIF